MKFRIVDNAGDERHPFALLDEAGTVIRIDFNPRRLSDWAFENDATEVRWDCDLRKADEAPWKQH